MLPRKGRDLSARNQFSFSSSKDLYREGRHGRENSPYGAEYDAWAERIKGNNYSYLGKADDRKPGAWTRRASFSDYDHGKHDREGQDVRWLGKREEEEEEIGSGTPSPPLWKNSASTPVSASASPVHAQVAQFTRAQEIVRFRQEMLDLVRDLPESGYELSLRDMVRPPTPPRTAAEAGEEAAEAGEEAPEAKKEEAKDKKTTKKKVNTRVKQMARSESMEPAGFLLKMFTPASVAGGRRRSSGGSNSFAKVSPRPPAVPVMALEGGEKVGVEVDGEWWKKNKFSGSEGSTTSSSSKSSSSSSSSKSRGR